MMKVQPWLWFAAGLAVAAMVGVAMQAQAQAPRTATCVSFAGYGLGGSGEKALERDKPMVVANWQSIGPVAETWVNAQLAAGKDQFFAATVATNAAVVCAW